MAALVATESITFSSGWQVFLDPSYRVLVVERSQCKWIPLRFIDFHKWVPIWNGQEMSACRLLDIVEEREERNSWPVVDTFAVDAATTMGLLPDESVDRVQLFYRWSLPPDLPEYECHASHDPTNLLPMAFQWKPAILYGTIDVAVSISGLHVLDIPGVEIMEGVQMSQGVRKALSRGPEMRPCFCWRDVARKVLINGGDPRGTLTMRIEVEDDEMRCEGIQCTSFLELQARLLMNARSSTSKSDRHAVIIGHSDKYVIQTLRRILATIGAQSRKTSYIQNTGEHCGREFYKLFWYPELEDYIDPRKDHGPTFTSFRPVRMPASPPYCVVQFADKGTFLVDGVRYLPYAESQPKLTGRPWSHSIGVRTRRYVR